LDDSGKTQDGVRAVDRALAILLAFTAKDSELTVSELMKRVDLSRPTGYRLLRTLERKQFLVASGEPQRFRLGPSAAQLAQAWTASVNLGALAQPIMRGLWEQTGETVALFVPEGSFRRCVAEIPSPQVLNYRRGVGYRERLVFGASGRAILAHSPNAITELGSQSSGLPIELLKKLPQQLAQIRNRGFAVSRDELIQGAVAVAAPFFNGPDQVAGSIAVFGPSARLDAAQVEKFGKLLVREARELSKALGQTQTDSGQ
jgi:IclR family transcriptional regulator, acetate operon repressor